jgi:hypothetical protein
VDEPGRTAERLGQLNYDLAVPFTKLNLAAVSVKDGGDEDGTRSSQDSSDLISEPLDRGGDEPQKCELTDGPQYH